MEFPRRGQSSHPADADDDDRRRLRFPDSTPPSGNQSQLPNPRYSPKFVVRFFYFYFWLRIALSLLQMMIWW